MKKGLILALAMVLAVCLGIGGTLAYLFVTTQTVTNTFSPSDITLTLVETDAEGNSVSTNDYQMIPGVEMKKDPKVTASGDVNFYVFVKVDKVNNPDTYLNYSIASGWTELTKDSGVYYQEVAANATFKDVSILTGDKVTTKPEITKEQMNALEASGKLPKLSFTAYAFQKDGFTAAQAWTELNKPAN